MPATLAILERLSDGGLKLRSAILIAVGLLPALSASACARGPETQPAADLQELTRDPLRFVTWNIQKCEGGRDAVVAELRKLDADIVCLQEVIEPRGNASTPNQTREIATALGMNWYSQGGRLDEARNQCLAILCRAPLSEPQTPTTAAERNYAVVATTRWKGQPLRIVCVHLAGTYKLNAEHVSKTSLDRTRDWEALLKTVPEWRTATVLAGDFNTLPAAPQFDTLAESLVSAGDPGPTFPSQSPALRLDHVWLTRDLLVQSSQSADTQSADHRPILVEITRIPAAKQHVRGTSSPTTTQTTPRTDAHGD